MTEMKLEKAVSLKRKIEELDKILDDTGGMIEIARTNFKQKVAYPTSEAYGEVGSGIVALLKQERDKLEAEFKQL